MNGSSRSFTESRLLGFVLACVVIAFWGSAFTAIRIGLESFGPGELALFRFATAGVVAGMIFARKIKVPCKKDFPRLVIVSLFGITSYHLLLNFGQRVVPPGTAALLVQTVPVWTALLATAMGYESIRWREWLGVAVALAGTVIIVLGQGKNIAFSGNALLILIAALSTAVYFVFGRSLTVKYGSTTFTVWSLWVGTVPMLWFVPSAVEQWGAAAWPAVMAFLFLGIFPTVVGYSLWMHVIEKLGSSRTAFFLYLSPIIAITVAWLWYGIVPTGVTLLGGALAIAGVVIINTRKKENV